MREEGGEVRVGEEERSRTRLVEGKVDWEGDDKIESVKGRSDGVGHCAVLKIVIGKVRDRECLHKGHCIAHCKDEHPLERGAAVPRLVGGAHVTKG